MSVADVEPRRWLFGPVPDLLIGCGLLYALIFELMLLFGPDRVPSYVAPLLVLVFSTPHYGATLLRVYEQRSERRRYAFFSIWVTLMIGIWFVTSQHWAAAGSWLLTVYLTWSPWHYTGQNYGIAVMLLGRRDVALDRDTKRWLHVAFILSYAVYFGVIHESSAWAASRELPLGSEGIRFLPIGIPPVLTAAAAIAYGGALAAALYRLQRRASLSDLLPALLLLALQALWFALPAFAFHWQIFPPGADIHIQFLLWIAVAHALQYLWITAYYARASRGWSGATRFFAKTFAAGAAVWTLPAIVFAPRPVGGIGYETGLSLLIGSAVNLHHFVLDGAIWKLRSGPIARVLIRSESAEEVDGAIAGASWTKRAVLALAGASALIASFVFSAQYFLVPRALEANEPARAAALLDALDVVGRDSSMLRGQLASLAIESGRDEEAVTQLGRSVELLPTTDGLGTLVDLLARLGRFDEAASHCDELLALAPENPTALRLAAAVYQRVGRGADARALARRAKTVKAATAARANPPVIY